MAWNLPVHASVRQPRMFDRDLLIALNSIQQILTTFATNTAIISLSGNWVKKIVLVVSEPRIEIVFRHEIVQGSCQNQWW